MRPLKVGDKFKCINSLMGIWTKGNIYTLKEMKNGLYYLSNDSGTTQPSASHCFYNSKNDYGGWLQITNIIKRNLPSWF